MSRLLSTFCFSLPGDKNLARMYVYLPCTHICVRSLPPISLPPPPRPPQFERARQIYSQILARVQSLQQGSKCRILTRPSLAFFPHHFAGPLRPGGCHSRDHPAGRPPPGHPPREAVAPGGPAGRGVPPTAGAGQVPAPAAAAGAPDAPGLHLQPGALPDQAGRGIRIQIPRETTPNLPKKTPSKNI